MAGVYRAGGCREGTGALAGEPEPLSFGKARSRQPAQQNLDEVAAGKPRVFLDGQYRLQDAPRALAALGAGDVRGKAVLSIVDGGAASVG